jgi:type II secretory pathway pseudopilin PulG
MNNFRFAICDLRFKSAPPAARRSQFAIRNSQIPSAFTVIELLIVIGIIVLVLLMALPAMNFLSGSKSVESAQNQISAFLGVARTEAIAEQTTAGVFFYIDPKSGLITLARVQASDAPAVPVAGVDVYLDLSSDDNGLGIKTPRETITLPRGIGIEVLDDAGGSAGPPAIPANDRYIGFNTANGNGGPATKIPYGGVILFDNTGQLVSNVYAFKAISTLTPANYSPMGVLLHQPSTLTVAGGDKDVVPVVAAVTTGLMLKSQVGFVLFDIDAFKNQTGGSLSDEQVTSTGTYDTQEQANENWLDSNGFPLLINRYNGTLVKGD